MEIRSKSKTIASLQIAFYVLAIAAFTFTIYEHMLTQKERRDRLEDEGS